MRCFSIATVQLDPHDSPDTQVVDASGAMANPMYQSAHSGPVGSSRTGDDIMATAR